MWETRDRMHAGRRRQPLTVAGAFIIGLAVAGCSGPAAPSSGTAPPLAAPPAPAAPAPCIFAVADEHRRREVAAAGAVFSVPISADAGCVWSVSVASPFVTVDPTSGTGSGNVTITIASNEGEPRTADVNIAGQTITVRQLRPDPVASGCNFSVSPERLSVSAAGGETSVDVDTTSACEWTAEAGDSFITMGEVRRTGRGRAEFRVAPNPGRARSASLVVAGRLVTVAQAASAACVTGMKLSPADYPAAGGSGRLEITAPLECDWQVQTELDVVTVSPTSGSGTTTLELTVGANGASGGRTIEVTAGGKTAVLTQGGAGAPTPPAPTPPGPTQPPSPPPPSPTPPSGPAPPSPGPGTATLFAFTSSPGDYIGGGQSGTLVSPATPFTARYFAPSTVTVTIGPQSAFWNATFSAPSGQELRAGTYGNAARSGFSGTAPGLSIISPGRGCNQLSGAFVVHVIERTAAGTLKKFHATFVQHCEGAAAALSGEVVYLAPPANLPTPQLSASTSGFRFESEPGDWVANGASGQFTPATATFTAITAEGGRQVRVTVTPPSQSAWRLIFGAPSGSALAPGVYADATRDGVMFGAGAGIDVTSSQGCNVTAGTFAVHAIEFGPQQTLRRLHATFEQRCDNREPALRGEVVAVIPAMEPPAPTSNPTASFLAFSSAPGEFIGGGQTGQWAATTTSFVVRDLYYGIEVDIIPQGAPSPLWKLAMDANSGPPSPGVYYMAGAYRTAATGFSFWGDGRACFSSPVTAFQVHALTRQAGAITRLHVTFEQRCAIDQPGLRGELVYIAP